MKMKRLVLPVVAVSLLIPTAGLAFAHQARPAAAKPLLEVGKNAKFGKILVNAMKVTSLNHKKFAKGFTVYHLLKENTGTFACTGGCLSFWPPLLLPAGMKLPKGTKGVTDKLGFVKRPGVGRQVTYDGWPLYFFRPDKKPGDTNGDGVQAFNSVWHVVGATPMVSLTVNISPDSTWGAVSMSYKYHKKTFQSSCTQNKCTSSVHAGVTISLSETAKSPSTWPFSQWTVDAVNAGGSTTSSNSAMTMISNDDYDVTATYIYYHYP